jgi:hypothetical protein
MLITVRENLSKVLQTHHGEFLARYYALHGLPAEPEIAPEAAPDPPAKTTKKAAEVKTTAKKAGPRRKATAQ